MAGSLQLACHSIWLFEDSKPNQQFTLWRTIGNQSRPQVKSPSTFYIDRLFLLEKSSCDTLSLRHAARAYVVHAPASDLGKRRKRWQVTTIRGPLRFDTNRFAKPMFPAAARESTRRLLNNFCGTLRDWNPARRSKLRSPHCPQQKQISVPLLTAPRIKRGYVWPRPATPGIFTYGKLPGNPEPSLTGT
jgi:hypothetical protein